MGHMTRGYIEQMLDEIGREYIDYIYNERDDTYSIIFAAGCNSYVAEDISEGEALAVITAVYNSIRYDT